MLGLTAHFQGNAQVIECGRAMLPRAVNLPPRPGRIRPARIPANGLEPRLPTQSLEKPLVSPIHPFHCSLQSLGVQLGKLPPHLLEFGE
jgi:hypothetical protein